MTRVWVPSWRDEEFLAELRPRLDENIELVEEPPCDVVVAGVPDEEQIAGCKAIVIPYAGVPKTTRERAQAAGVALFNLHHNAAPTAELAVALLLAAAKRVIPLDRALRNNDWLGRYESRDELMLFGRTAIVCGLGSIGSRVAEALTGLGMRVEGLRRADRTRLPELLPQAHAVVMCVPWTPETEGMLGADELARLPDGAVIVNVARGPVVDERALYDELRSGRLRAGLDVWYVYPKTEEQRGDTAPSEFPFGELDNVVMSPHRGGQADRTEVMRAEHLAITLNALARGEEAPHRVNFEAGY
ncbi:MAG: NAD(P)-dependent oxidoreductase [Planctomycetota bacterium]|jgi:phosphoglycerate dehydrogenase-like enzyme